ncbi:aldose 1-epimerase [Planctomycetaceae bacterium]|jgi:aldose 1-epimerase|nr:aldose 1-epimerase [Planctomycetaceae bacterium]MDC0308078.1 aldose 1-epimerase [Planctomycetaceae bacterium]MDG2391238.1 aldose 1-epimerase [Planctomycetaceae bacterium]
MPDVIELSRPDSLTTAKITPTLGFNCFDFTVHQDGKFFSLIDSEESFPQADSRPSGHGIPLLFPFPNRIRGDHFEWEGQTYQLPLDQVSFNKTNAIHGFCLDRPWRITKQSGHGVTAEFQLSVDAPARRDFWPADFIIRCTYTLNDASLSLDVEIENPDSVPLPWGFGTHAYFRLPLSTKSQVTDCLFQAPVDSQWNLEECLPTGQTDPLSGSLNDLPEGIRMGEVALDAAFRLMDGAGRCEIMDEAVGYQIAQSFSSEFTQMIIFTPPGRDAVCLEPYTCMTDAVNLTEVDTGWQVLPPGKTQSLNVTIALEPIVA